MANSQKTENKEVSHIRIEMANHGMRTTMEGNPEPQKRFKDSSESRGKRMIIYIYSIETASRLLQISPISCSHFFSIDHNNITVGRIIQIHVKIL
ncbi:hypothetical protein SDC9_168069 [bioreactor metagenome]|uniref:Uncharacterized protein n=1 Tax=bioreactor metagenome TaxID=1076179 RepID=A0A645G449_9ZZZZ